VLEQPDVGEGVDRPEVVMRLAEERLLMRIRTHARMDSPPTRQPA
jgi:hypothetical protein